MSERRIEPSQRELISTKHERTLFIDDIFEHSGSVFGLR